MLQVHVSSDAEGRRNSSVQCALMTHGLSHELKYKQGSAGCYVDSGFAGGLRIWAHSRLRPTFEVAASC